MQEGTRENRIAPASFHFTSNVAGHMMIWRGSGRVRRRSDLLENNVKIYNFRVFNITEGSESKKLRKVDGELEYNNRNSHAIARLGCTYPHSF